MRISDNVGAISAKSKSYLCIHPTTICTATSFVISMYTVIAIIPIITSNTCSSCIPYSVSLNYIRCQTRFFPATHRSFHLTPRTGSIFKYLEVRGVYCNSTPTLCSRYFINDQAPLLFPLYSAYNCIHLCSSRPIIS
jgi:hypothetical protein